MPFTDDGYFSSDTQGTGNTATGYAAPPGIDTRIPKEKKAYDERGLPIAGEQNVKQDKGGVLQGSPLSPAEKAFWAQHPGGAPASEVYGFDPTGPGTAGAGAPQPSPVAGRAMFQVDTDSLIANAVARRSELEASRVGLGNRRAALIQQLSATGVDRHGRMSPQGRAIQEQLKGLAIQERDLMQQERFADHEATLRVNSAFRNTQLAEKNLDMQRKEKTARDASAVMNGLSRIEATYQHGTPEFRDAVTALTEANPMYIHHATASAAVRKAAEFHDVQEEKRLTSLSNNLQKQTGLTPEEFAAIPPENIQAGRIVAGKFSNDATALLDPKYKDKPWEKIPQAEKDRVNKIMQRGDVIQIDTGKGYTVPVMRVDYENFKRAFSGIQPQQQPQNVDPKIDLARRALNDPSATEAHKAAARKILGLQ